MGSDKRERQRARRSARIDEAQASQERQVRQRRLLTIGLVALVAVLVGAVVIVTLGQEDDTTVAGDGGDCIGLTDALPPGAPEFEVPVGPPPTELVIEDLVVGDGEVAGPGDTVEANYVGVACTTGVVFDSSYERGTPTEFSLSAVIQGWQEGIPGMAVGGQRLLIIPSDMAYGPAGAPPDIGPDEPLIFFVELTGVQPGPGGEDALGEMEPTQLGSTECPPAEGAERQLSFDGAPPMCLDDDVEYEAVFVTDRGDIRVALDATDMPSTVNNFVVLARYGYYDDTEIFRSDPSIGIIQGGAPTTNSAADPGPGYTIGDEADGFTYEPGQLVMARTPQPNSSGAQFFFTITDAAAALDAQGTYLVFGQVIEGMDVLEDILDSHEADPTSGLGGSPSPTVILETVQIIER
ncbi:MAG: peptidylprolyl isomerase [Acidimicrobiia bacterium]|nr:peptidylprolyl isomerase [Acidimicrobiia bacterium]